MSSEKQQGWTNQFTSTVAEVMCQNWYGEDYLQFIADRSSKAQLEETKRTRCYIGLNWQ